MSCRKYAERRGVSVEAVSQAIKAGRLRESVVLVNGNPKIGDPDLADREWNERTRPTPYSSTVSGEPQPKAATLPPPPDYLVSRARREVAAADKEEELAKLARLNVAERERQLIRFDAACAEVDAVFNTVRNRLLGVPSQLGQRMPDIAARVVPVAEDLIHEALEELALSAEKLAGDGDPDEE